MNIGLIGVGTVGSGVVHIDQHNRDRLLIAAKKPFRLKRICDLNFAASPYDLSGYELTSNWKEITEAEDIGVVVELIGGEEPARSMIESALRHKKHVVTANKLVMAKHGRELLAIALQNGVHILFEASVGGAIPVIKPLMTTLAPNHILGIYGIVNGTTNFILTQMYEKNAPYEDVLKEAQKLGYAEADPKSDVGGYDSQYKLAVLASVAFHTHIDYRQILVEGITGIAASDMMYGREMDLTIKLLAIARMGGDGELELRVHPVMLDNHHPLASVNGVFNAVYVVGDSVGDAMFFGRGAGSIPTASSVWSDILDLINGTPYLVTNLTSVKVKHTDHIESEYYFRFRVKDKTGVLADIAGIFAKNNISIKNAVQKGLGDDAELMIVSHTVTERAKNKAVEQIQKLQGVSEIGSVIRVGI
ncbi:MAG: homoserine dehydrogenase [Candidatus Margulisiibacteriota bacterium]